MKINDLIFTALLIALMVFAFQTAGCGSSGGSSSAPAAVVTGGGDTDGDDTGEEEEEEVEPPAVINVTAASDSINPEDSTLVYARAFNASGGAVSGLEVVFAIDNPVLAYITSSATTNSAGVATATLTARELSGEVGITATAEGVSNETVKTITILDEAAPSIINLSINPNSILVLGTSTVTAGVLDTDGDPVPNGTTVVFEVENDLYGNITPSAITNSGSATATFEAADQPGDTTINVSSGLASASIDIEIIQAPASAIEFLSAEPQVIAVKESGGVEISVVKFIVKDSNGNPLSGINVSLKMDGPNGGEYIDPSNDGTPDTIDVSTDDDGIAHINLHSGYQTGPVTVSATIYVYGTEMTVESSVVSIGGGVPSMKHFSISAELLNLPGLEYNNRTTDITAYLADRFGNYNVLKGTTVSFASEVGLAIDTSEVTLGEDGLATVIVRTQQSVAPGQASPEDVFPESWETDLQSYAQSIYGVTFTGHPRDGLCSMLVYAKGEEHFNDTNANGVYNTGETFGDTFDDPFIDFNGDGLYDGPGSSDPEEIYVDSADPRDGNWDGENGEWDDNKHIFANFELLLTGGPIVAFDTAGFSIQNGGSQIINVLICDSNMNILSPGTTVSIASDVGKVSPSIRYEYPNTNAIGSDRDSHLGLIEFTIGISDADPDENEAEAGFITVTVNWEGITYTYLLAGIVDAP